MSSSSNPQLLYDVFISFRGKDTRSHFVSHLHNALSNAGFNTFVDQQLRKGREVGPELLRVIEGSRISIVVFSKSYTESSWCLDELKKIMECRRANGQVVMPIFYDVDPTVVRHQKGAFGKALRATVKKKYMGGEVMKNELSIWTRALTQAGILSGWDLKNFRSEGELLKEIVGEVSKKLDSTSLSITKYPVGLKSHYQKVIEFIEKQSSTVCIIGIWGMGGSGKTTLAKAIYNQIHHNFVDRSFIEDIREVCEKDDKGHVHLQQQLLSDVLKRKEKIHSIALGETTIEKKLHGKRALVVLDDVTTTKQLDALCGNRKWFGLGSVLIVTTRDLSLFKSLKVYHLHEMKEMSSNESLELFSWHAFRKSSPTEDFSILSSNVVAYCGGLPLALEVLGSYLHERPEQEWRSVLSKLERIPNDQVQEKLRISYDGLKDDVEKDIFLDICCFFIGKDRVHVTKILNGCRLWADIGITVLIERSLIKVENNKLGMHNLLRDMGREIVRESSKKEPGKRSRLWFHEDVHDVLTKNTGTETVEGLVLKLQKTEEFKTESFKEMKNLRLLQLDCVDLIGNFGYLSKQLRWVNWQGCSLPCIPDDFYQENVVVLDLKYSNLKQVWKETKLLENLKILNLSHSKNLEKTPDFSKLPNLVEIIMKDCPSLSEVDQSIGDLSNLRLINLKDCTNLSNLPRKFYQLKSLNKLILSGCSKIDKFEEDIVQMESLTIVIAKDTAVKKVPYSIVLSKSIGYISLSGYEGLSRDVFPSLIWSWMSPTRSVSFDVESNNLLLSILSKLRGVKVQCFLENQVQEFRRFLDNLYDASFTGLNTPHASQILDLSTRSVLIGMGRDTRGKSISQGLTTNDSSHSFLPCYNHPSELADTSALPSVSFQVPEVSDCCMKGITILVVYSTPETENMATECLPRVLIINYTKFTIQIYKPDTVRCFNDEEGQSVVSNLGVGDNVEIYKPDTAMCFNDEDGQSVVSNLGVGDNVEILVALGHRLTVKETAVYLIYSWSVTTEIETSTDEKMEPSLEEEVQPSPNVNMEPSLIVKKESLPKPNKTFFTRLAERVGERLWSNRNRGFNNF